MEKRMITDESNEECFATVNNKSLSSFIYVFILMNIEFCEVSEKEEHRESSRKCGRNEIFF